MNMSTSPDIMSATISQAQAVSLPAPPPERGIQGELPDAASAMQKLGGSLTDDAKDSVLAGVVELESSGASFEEIRSFVDSELESNGVDMSGGGQRSGQLVDMMI
ncbi:hypothetical protein [Granulosicoccus antarcticus]|uniref:Uncharacterized protein n=1 Tax=Granulosicoccus antarcticus IMCC3135 TaxID=1192854 RepID=A0A2Z2NHB8_9GAMM|nr:hypothetical protein [Granulosicoccus antarcticus]ASJ70696.1 hypothetical protein IMCC3135_02915 [Granulosicoccus antarcticus IMCC3135]